MLAYHFLDVGILSEKGRFGGFSNSALYTHLLIRIHHRKNRQQLIKENADLVYRKEGDH
jgi:hypothetical protein